MLESVVKKMPWTPDFEIDHDSRKVQLLNPSHESDLSAFCNAAFQRVINSALALGTFLILDGQHSELFPILGANYPVRLERFAFSLFGLVTRGAFLTAYTRSASGDLRVWVSRRSPHIFMFPGMLDSTVAGGVRLAESPFECIVHEADEEASLPEELIRKGVQSCGMLSYIGMSDQRCKGEQGLMMPDLIYVFDIELNEGVVPKPRDDEVQDFDLWEVERVKRALFRSEFKPGCALVLIDFFLRHGIITDENEKDFVEIAMRLHRRLPFPTAPSSEV